MAFLGLSTGRRKTDIPEFNVDLLDRAATAWAVAEARPDLVVHLAAQASVGLSQNGASELTWAVNLSGTLNLALAVARHAPTATVLFASSGEVYGASLGGTPACESTPLKPLHPYARSKVLAERALADVLPASSRLVIARPFNHTGPGQGENFALPSFAAQVARIEAGLSEPRMRVGNLESVRDFLDVRDVVAAYMALLEAASRLPRRFIVNVASGTPYSLRAMLDILREHAHCPFDLEVDPTRLRPSDVPIAYGDPALLRATTGWAPKIPVEAMLADLLSAARTRWSPTVASSN